MNSFAFIKIAVFGQGNQDIDAHVQECFDQLRAIFPLKIGCWDNLLTGTMSNASAVFFSIVCMCSESPMWEASKLDAPKQPPRETARTVPYPDGHPPASPSHLPGLTSQSPKDPSWGPATVGKQHSHGLGSFWTEACHGHLCVNSAAQS